MALARKTFFARTVTVPAATAVLLNTLMAAAGWVEIDTREGGQCIIKPTTATLYLGDDENVRDAAAGPNYQGFPLEVGESVNLAESPAAGVLVDPNVTWVYSVGSQSMGILFQGL